MSGLWSLTLTEMSARLRAGDVDSEALVASCLARIAERDPDICAWRWLEPERAIEQARACDAAPSRGPLHGLPIAVKDIIDTADMPTGYGSPIYDRHRPPADAACVAALRAAGAVILGKTTTTEFATYKPTETRNPRNLDRTPGGSSSGSAAAVAAGMAPLALGTQTVGSVIRPASFCGVVGFKASFGRLPIAGVKPLAAELDSLGCFARTVEDVALWFSVLAGEPQAATTGKPPRIALFRTAQWSEAEPACREAVERAAEALRRAGATIVEPTPPPEFDALVHCQDVIFAAGAVEALAVELRDHSALLSPALSAVLERGKALAPERLAEARLVAERARAWMAGLFGEVDFALAPSARGEAPEINQGTGDPLFNRMWTLLLGPCLTLPVGAGASGLPIGVQLIGARGRDAAFLAQCRWAAATLMNGEPAAIADGV